VAVRLWLRETRLQSEYSVPQCAICYITRAACDQECSTGGNAAAAASELFYQIDEAGLPAHGFFNIVF